LENRPRSQNPRFISSTISLSAFSVFNAVLGLAGIVVLTRQYSQTFFGAYTFVLVVTSFLVQISTFGLELGISRFIAGSKNEPEKERYLNTAVFIRLGAIIFAGLLAWIGKTYLVEFFGGSLLPDVFLYIPLLFVLESFRALFRSVLQGCLRFTRIGITDVITSSSNFLMIMIYVFVIKGDQINMVILIRALATLLGCGYAYLSIPLRKGIAFHLDVFKELLKFGFPLQINDFLQFISTRIDTIVIAALLGPANIALYEVARKIPDNLRVLYEPFRSVYYPFLVKKYKLEDRTQASKLLMDAVRFVAFIMILGTAITVLFSREIIVLLFSDKYSASAPVFVILMINLSLALISNVMGTSIVAVGDTKKPMIINTFNAVISLIGSVLFIPGFRIIGAALANTFGTAFAYPLNLFFLRRKIELSTWINLKLFTLFGVWSLLVIFVKPESILVKLLFLLIFLAASYVLSIFTREDINIMLKGSGLRVFKSQGN